MPTTEHKNLRKFTRLLVPIFLKFKQGPGAEDCLGQACFRLQFRLEPGGSMAHSSLQLQPNKSTAGVPVNLGRAGPRWRPSLVAQLAESLRTGWGGGASQSQDLVPISQLGCCPAPHGRFQAAILPVGSPAGRPGIRTSDSDRDVVTEWPARRDRRRTSDIRQKVPRSTVCN